MEELEGVKINKYDYGVEIDLNKFKNTYDSRKILNEMRIDLLLNNSESLNDVIKCCGFDIEFKGIKPYLKVENAPADMTIKELKEYNEDVDNKNKIEAQLKELLFSTPLLSCNQFNKLFRRIHPFLTEQDLKNINEMINKLEFCYSKKVQTIEYFVDLIRATKTQKPM